MGSGRVSECRDCRMRPGKTRDSRGSSMRSGRGGESETVVWDQGEVGRVRQLYGIRERWGE